MLKPAFANKFVLIPIIFVLFYASFPVCASNLMPFSREEIKTNIRDGIQVNGSTGDQSLSKYEDLLDNSSDIQKITYSSDGKAVNATLWLGGEIMYDPSKFGANLVAYGALIDIDNNPFTGKLGVDFQKEIQWTNRTSSWSDLLVEYPSGNRVNYRILELNKNDTNFIDMNTNQTFVPISLDLKSITSPSSFKVIYYSVVAYSNSKTIIDLSNWINMPAPKYTFSTTPYPVVLRQGQEKIIGILLESNSGSPKIENYIRTGSNSPINIELNPSKFANSPTSLKITVPNEASVGNYIIPILTNVSIGTIFPSDYVEFTNNFKTLNISVPTEGFTTISANLTVSVIEAETISERVKEFWGVYGALISLIGAGFAGGVSTYLFDYLKSKGRTKS